MLELIGKLTPDLIASGIIGLLMAGFVAKNAINGWIEARAKLQEAEKSAMPLVTAMGMSWDRDQVERGLQMLEDIRDALLMNAKHSEVIAKAQSVMSDQFQQTTQSKLSDILKRLEREEKRSAETTPRARRRTDG